VRIAAKRLGCYDAADWLLEYMVAVAPKEEGGLLRPLRCRTAGVPSARRFLLRSLAAL
jgi:hypothetical protein